MTEQATTTTRAPSVREGLIKSGSEDFFPPHLAQAVTKFNSFPASKWGFITFDVKGDGVQQKADWQTVTEMCQLLKSVPADAEVACSLSPTMKQEALFDWARDYPLRHPYPGVSVTESLMANTLAKAMVVPDRDLVNVLRHDPLGSSNELMKRVVDQNLIQLESEQGYLFDRAASRVVIPLHFKHEPMETGTTAEFMDAADAACAAVHKDAQSQEACRDKIGYTGGFFAAVENKQQIMQDLTNVSWLSVLILLFFFGGVWLSKRSKLFLLMLPVAVGLLVATAATIALFGGIHGLVLSFGAGIVGLSVDYGLHAAFHHDRSVWKSNFLGLLTTVTVLVVVAFSTIPLMRQLMIFTIIGLVASYLAIFILFRWFQRGGRQFHVQPLRFKPRFNKFLGTIALTLSLVGCVGIFLKRYDLNLQQLNFMAPRTAEITAWLHERMGRVMPLFQITTITDTETPEIMLAQAQKDRSMAEQNGIRLENVAAYLPSIPEQTKNLTTWFNTGCQPRLISGENSQSQTLSQFFAPYLEAFDCHHLAVKTLDGPSEIPAYVSHLFSGTSWLSIWMPRDKAQEQAIRVQAPSAFSLLDVAESFPKLLLAELRWMLPTAVGLIFLTLLLVYRRILPALAALLPFFCGLGCVFVTMYATGMSVNFIVIVSMLMLCGLSVDYGIFAVGRVFDRKLFVENEDGSCEEEGGEAETASALLFAAISTSSGMIPLVFCHHPVLVSLGLPLCIGIPGALAGAFWATPLLLRKRMSSSARSA